MRVLKAGETVWLKSDPSERWERTQATVETGEIVNGTMVVRVARADKWDDGLREVTIDQIEELDEILDQLVKRAGNHRFCQNQCEAAFMKVSSDDDHHEFQHPDVQQQCCNCGEPLDLEQVH